MLLLFFFTVFLWNEIFKLCCDTRFQRAFTACGFVYKVITLFGSNQSNYIVNANACSKRMLKTHVATQFWSAIYCFLKDRCNFRQMIIRIVGENLEYENFDWLNQQADISTFTIVN